jgi:hypothetical protein
MGMTSLRSKYHQKNGFDCSLRGAGCESQEEFARHFGVNKRTVQDWEQGRRIRRDQHEHSLW